MEHSTKSIIVVDDDPFIVELLTKFFDSKGFHVIGTTDPENVFAMAIAEKPHLILSDIAMPGMDGLSLLKLLKENPATQNIPLVLVTSSARLEDVQTGLSSGAAAYLMKPVDWDRDWPKLQAILWMG